MKPEILYHYSGNIKCFNILSNRSIRLSDIRKSNDSAELQIFYPVIIKAIEDAYKKDPFEFEYEGHKNKEAISIFLDSIRKFIDEAFDKGKLTSYVLCLSEEGDLLSQWRGYADNGKGCAIGFSINELQEFCKKSEGVFKLEQIQYLTKQQIEILISEKAKCLNQILASHYEYCKEKFPTQPVKIFVKFLFDLIEEIGKTIIYKSVGFSEEKEWRLYINNWISKSFVGYTLGEPFNKIAKYLEGKIFYHFTDNDIIPFTIFEFGDDPSKYIIKIISGPSNKIAKKDMQLFLEQSNYQNTSFSTSEITYR